MKINGVWLPIITPFANGVIDYDSYEKMIDHYLSYDISGMIPIGTTGEIPVVTDVEYEEIIERTVAAVAGCIPVYVGLGGNYTDKLLKQLKKVEKYKIEGILSVCPYYSRPNQRGLSEHFLKLAEATDLNIIIYNIPYRTGVNLLNETLFKLAEQKNVVGVKDSNGNIKQSMDLIKNKPRDFSVLTGEDILYYNTLVNGGDGGILASAHLMTEKFVEIYSLLEKNDHKTALLIWRRIADFIPLLFEEPNPAPLKYCLKRLGLIKSAEVRLPLTPVSDGLKKELDSNLSF